MMLTERSEGNPAQPVLKWCAKCKEHKDRDLFSNTSNKRHLDGKYPTCKACKYEQVLKWRRDNPDKVAGYNKKRYPVPPEVRSLLLNYYGVKCMKCGSTDRIEVDHIVPLINGGTNDLDNLQLLCKTCNVSKKHWHSTDYRPFPRLVVEET